MSLPRQVLVLGCCAATSCGFSVGGSAAPSGDARPTDVQLDAPDAPGPPSCHARWLAGTVTLGTPVAIAAVNMTGADDRDPYLSADGLTLYLSSSRGGNTDIYVATRPTTASTFSAPAKALDLSSLQVDSKLSMTADGMTVVLASDRAGGAGSSDLWLANRVDATGQFGTFTRTAFGGLDDGDAQLDPELNTDGTHVYFAIGSPQRIVMSSRASLAEAFGGATDVINSTMSDADPSLSPDERVIVFASRRSGGLGGDDIWYATRANAGVAFGTAQLVPVVNGAQEDGDPIVSRDGCTVYFGSNRAGSWDLYQAPVTSP